MNPWRKSAPNRKVIRGLTETELAETIERAAYGWKPISDVLYRDGWYEVLVEVKKREVVEV